MTKSVDRRERLAALWGSADVRICHYCGCTLSRRIATLDHKIPVSEGGTDRIKNLVICCRTCNRNKSSLDYDLFKTLMLPVKAARESGLALPSVSIPALPKREKKIPHQFFFDIQRITALRGRRQPFLIWTEVAEIVNLPTSLVKQLWRIGNFNVDVLRNEEILRSGILNAWKDARRGYAVAVADAMQSQTALG